MNALIEQILSANDTSGIIFVNEILALNAPSDAIEAFNLEILIEQPKGKTRVFDLLLEDLKTKPLLGQLIEEFNEINTVSFKMLRQETINQLFFEFSQAVDESQNMTVDEAAELLLMKNLTRKLILEIESVITTNQRVNNLGFERKWSYQLVEQLYNDMKSNQNTYDLIISLTKIFNKEGSNQILNEIYEVLDQ